MTKVSDIFQVFSGSKLDFGKQVEDADGLNFVSRNSNNNGVVGKVANENSFRVYKKGDITVTLGGSYLLSCFVQNEDFVTSQNVAVLRPKKDMSEIEKWFYCYALTANRFKFTAFGREVNKYLKNIELPEEIPDWVYKKDVSLPNSHIKIDDLNNQLLRDREWKYFKYSDIFDIKNGFYNKKPVRTEEGDVPFLGATEKNNGVSEYFSINDIQDSSKTGNGNNATLEEKIFPGKSVCVTNNGSVGFAYYQNEPFTCSHDVNPLYIKNGDFNVYTGIFIATMIMKDRYRWQYGRKWRPIRMKTSQLYLPMAKDGSPDWEFMEKYISSLTNSDFLEK